MPAEETTPRDAADTPTAASAPVRSTTPPTPGAPFDEAPLSAATVETSTPFVGRWNELVSTTNWEKGRIIAEWRAELERSGAAVTEYSDEAWARLVGGVTSQHVGRLRRAHDRFGRVYEQYPGLYWSHFQAALDWPDAEMWLEGAITNKWSVSQLRAARWEAVGDPSDADQASDPRVIEGTLDEDSYSALVDRNDPAQEKSSERSSEGGDTRPTPARSEAAERSTVGEPDDGPDDGPTPATEAAPRVRPFKDLAALPDDVADAFEQFKLVILSHKLTGWEAISRDDLLGALEALKVLAMAPSERE
ncbi:hypothetical protein [Botrimarina sp.]|uniref:hypothetical protein n=1 Tax=Botrimarina sp. TaxID=2795802 RepID=UPI0032EC211D